MTPDLPILKGTAAATLAAILDAVSDGVYITDRDRVIRYWNAGAARASGFAPDQIIGRRCQDNILTHVDQHGRCLCASDCPLLAVMADGRVREADVFMHHKDGHRVPVRIRAIPIRNERGDIVAVAEVFSNTSELIAARQTIRALEDLAMTDPLTGLPNRRALELRLRQRLDEWRRYGWPVAVFLADIDHFKRFNDVYGHAVGDRALKMVGSAMACALRSSDVAGRWGGEEFLAIIANAPSGPELRALAERMRLLVEKSYLLVNGQPLVATVSIGVAQPNDHAGDVSSLLRLADQCLYQSKSAGRNRVTVAGEAEPISPAQDPISAASRAAPRAA
ncbi:sensor domain-containing diguanylate cyclase [Fontivita pretiosa]|uniref:sensor domain-containing diguanylate cyclase n=1 Tax=Fontivita pretiosa TaxID=2989684 RepID=UPI003D18301F